MKYTNAFFQLDIRKDGVYAHIYPAKNNGKPIAIREFIEYIENCGIKNYNISEINKAIEKATEETDVFISKDKISEIPETAKVWITSDKMMAIIRFYPPSVNGKYMTHRDILNELQRMDIKFGISE